MPQPILAQPPTPVARGSVGRASLAPRKRPWPVPQILGTVAKATPARPTPIVSQAVQIQPANIGIPASRWKTQTQEWLLGEGFVGDFFCSYWFVVLDLFEVRFREVFVSVFGGSRFVFHYLSVFVGSVNDCWWRLALCRSDSLVQGKF